MKRKILCTLICSLISAVGHGQAATVNTPQLGSTIHGDQETAVGLFLTPWKEQHATTTDRPPRLLDIELAPLDPAGLRHQVQLQQIIQTQRIQRLHR